jgi:hypothetical protein
MSHLPLWKSLSSLTTEVHDTTADEVSRHGRRRAPPSWEGEEREADLWVAADEVPTLSTSATT